MSVSAHLILSWTKHLQSHWSEILRCRTLVPLLEHNNIIDVCDEKFKWTVSHGFAASSTKERLLEKFLTSLESMRKQCQLLQRDADGDIPLQSAIRSRASKNFLEHLLTKFPDLTKDMLVSTNFKKRTPLLTAFEMRHWEAVEIILNLCISHKILPELTGVGALDPSRENKYATLLNEASKRGDIEYFNIFFQVCKMQNIDIPSAISVPDRDGVTAWHYAVQLDHEKLEKILSLLPKDVDLNTLYVDAESKSTMLHEAARSNSQQHEIILRKFGAKEVVDTHGFCPKERRRIIKWKEQAVLEQAPPSSQFEPHPNAPDNSQKLSASNRFQGPYSQSAEQQGHAQSAAFKPPVDSTVLGKSCRHVPEQQAQDEPQDHGGDSFADLEEQDSISQSSSQTSLSSLESYRQSANSPFSAAETNNSMCTSSIGDEPRIEETPIFFSGFDSSIYTNYNISKQ